MDVENIFHMKGGIGENSYAKNSSFQKAASDMVKHITIKAVQEVYLALAPESLGIADLGCSSGPNTLSIIKDIVLAIEEINCCKIKSPTPEFRVYLNDLPTNDFNSVFKSLPDFYSDLKKERNGGSPSLFIAGYPGSFYGRLFPNNCLHFVYSSYSLHWLSKVPPALYDEQGKPINKGNIYISKSSPPLVSQAYLMQFKEDFSLFLQSRSQELISGGCMVLILLGRVGPDQVDRGNSFFWELLSRSVAILVSQGEIEKEKLDSYDVHFYAPSKDEIEAEIRREGSFELVHLDILETEKDYDKTSGNYGAEVAMTVRAIQESMISHHFGEGILDTLFETYGRMVDEEVVKQEIDPISFVLVLRKL
ncbi:probable methyltransferase TCM_000336 isoform X1 [Ricinus communis]|uniref:Jasmonate O-methyltransferase, putative n=1 Tax=Ricinus communis TaxID=3988 RepID=B9S844_RICCO|nr:probable methyltransferase TCM_000336 isoform X1 [Ricinus communis]EEF40204.1 Jasmonate O-methyltransferase, putative [Ricinus communis]|eukprot:XP_002522163.1 probable caffeine synthase 2 isoform X1 [Ricinus communis]